MDGFPAGSTTISRPAIRANVVPEEQYLLSLRPSEDDVCDSTPAPQGLYDPALEHDACGVAFVVDLEGRRSHEMVDKGIAALCHLEHRGASGRRAEHRRRRRHPDPGARRFLREVVDFALPPAGSYATGIAFLPSTPSRPTRRRRRSARSWPARGWSCSAGATCPSTPSSLGEQARDAMPTFRQVFLAGPERQLRRARSRTAGLHRPQADRARGGQRRGGRTVYFPSLSARTLDLQGHAHHPAAAGVLSRPRGRAGRERHRPRALPLLDQHVPLVAAGPSVPLPRPQRRDQHAEGQPQLDAGPRGAAARATCSPATCRGSSPSARPTPATRPASTRRSSCCTSAAVRCTTPC